MYKRNSLWDEDKWNIHSSSGYAGHGSHEHEEQHYHKSEMYASNSAKEGNELYRSSEHQEEDRKKGKEGKEKTLADAVEQEGKYKKREEIAADTEHGKTAEMQHENKKDETKKKEDKQSIEEAINEAIKEEKQIMHLD